MKTKEKKFMKVSFTKRSKTTTIKLRKNLELHVHSAGVIDHIILPGHPKLEAGLGIHFDIAGLVAPRKLKKHEIAAITFNFDHKEVKKLFKKVLKLMQE